MLKAQPGMLFAGVPEYKIDLPSLRWMISEFRERYGGWQKGRMGIRRIGVLMAALLLSKI